MKLLDDEIISIRLEAIKNPSIPDEVLFKLLNDEDEDYDIRRMVFYVLKDRGYKLLKGGEKVIKLSQNRDVAQMSVREKKQLAGTTTDLDLLKELARDEEYLVR